MEAFDQDSRFRDFDLRPTKMDCETVDIRPCVVIFIYFGFKITAKWA
jgi:hypothetical protein